MLNFNKIFACISHTNNDDVTTETTFFFKQFGKIIRATYNGGNIKYGVLTGMVNDKGLLQASFHYFNANSEFHGGTCTFMPERRMGTSYQLHGLWTVAEENTEEIELILEELR